jgi:hypothetical protein
MAKEQRASMVVAREAEMILPSHLETNRYALYRETEASYWRATQRRQSMSNRELHRNRFGI